MFSGTAGRRGRLGHGDRQGLRGHRHRRQPRPDAQRPRARRASASSRWRPRATLAPGTYTAQAEQANSRRPRRARSAPVTFTVSDGSGETATIAAAGRHRRLRRHRRRGAPPNLLDDDPGHRDDARRQRLHLRHGERVPVLRTQLGPAQGAHAADPGRPRLRRSPTPPATSTTSARPPARGPPATTATTSAAGTWWRSTRGATCSSGPATRRQDEWLKNDLEQNSSHLHARAAARAPLQLRARSTATWAAWSRSGRSSTTTAPTWC